MSLQTIYVGLDLGSSVCRQAVVNADGSPGFSRGFPTSEKNLRCVCRTRRRGERSYGSWRTGGVGVLGYQAACRSGGGFAPTKFGVKANLQGYKRLLSLWWEQNGLCPVCDEKITKITGWHSHHIIYRVHGGIDGNSNRVLLHPNCHRQVHSKGLEVVKPRSKRSVTKA